MLDMTDSIAPKSDQMNSDDLLSGARTFTIADVRKSNNAEQPVDVVLVEFPQGRPFKPSKSMRRVMVSAWGPDASTYAGKRMTLFRDPSVKWGGQAVGGIRISHMSDITKPLTLALTETRGKKAPYRVEVLPDTAPVHASASAETLAKLAAMFERKGIPEDKRLWGVNQIIGGNATDLEVITQEDAQRVLTALESRPDVEPAPSDDDALWPDAAPVKP